MGWGGIAALLYLAAALPPLFWCVRDDVDKGNPTDWAIALFIAATWPVWPVLAWLEDRR